MTKYLVITLSFISAVANARNETLEKSGDYLQIALPVSAILSSYILDNEKTPENLRYTRFIQSFSLGLATTYAIKLSAEKQRPNLGNEQSFPSAHTFAAVSGASFINKRFGSYYGIPAYLLAGVVGYSRVDSRAHFADDVLAGAALAYLFNEFATRESALGVSINKDQIGVTINGSADFNEMKQPSNTFYFYLFMGPTYVQDLILSGNDNTDLKIDTLPREENYNYTSSIQFDYFLNAKNLLVLSLHPYEHLASGILTNNFKFEGHTLAAGEMLNFRWRQYNIDLNYNYSLLQSRYLDFFVGLGLNTNYARLEESSATSDFKYTTDRVGVVGNISSLLRLKFTDSFHSALWLNWYNDSETKYFNTKLDFVYRFSDRWSFLGRIARFEQKLELVEFKKQSGEGIIFADSAFNSMFLGVKYTF